MRFTELEIQQLTHKVQIRHNVEFKELLNEEERQRLTDRYLKYYSRNQIGLISMFERECDFLKWLECAYMLDCALRDRCVDKYIKNDISYCLHRHFKQHDTNALKVKVERAKRNREFAKEILEIIDSRNQAE